METLLIIIAFLSLILMITGFFSPKNSLFWMKDQSKRTRMISFLIYFPAFIIFASFASLFENGNNKEDNKDEKYINKNKKEWSYDKDIDLNTGDTIYKASLYAEGPFLSYYRAGNVIPNAIFTFCKNGDKKTASVYLTLGEFIEGDTIDVFFKGIKPDAKYTYKLVSNKEAVLNIDNIDAFMKKVNMECIMTLEIPIPKQDSKTVFSYTYQENSLNL